MIYHNDIGISAFGIKRKIKELVDQNLITLGGNRKLKIYGTLSCTSGKRMKMVNRVFFASEPEAIENGFRPCGHCMKQKYNKWKSKHLTP